MTARKSSSDSILMLARSRICGSAFFLFRMSSSLNLASVIANKRDGEIRRERDPLTRSPFARLSTKRRATFVSLTTRPPLIARPLARATSALHSALAFSSVASSSVYCLRQLFLLKRSITDTPQETKLLRGVQFLQRRWFRFPCFLRIVYSSAMNGPGSPYDRGLHSRSDANCAVPESMPLRHCTYMQNVTPEPICIA